MTTQTIISQDSYLFDVGSYIDNALENMHSATYKTMFKNIKTPFGSFSFEEQCIHKKDKDILKNMSKETFDKCVLITKKFKVTGLTHICIHKGVNYPVLRQTGNLYDSFDLTTSKWKNQYVSVFVEKDYVISIDCIEKIQSKLQTDTNK